MPRPLSLLLACAVALTAALATGCGDAAKSGDNASADSAQPFVPKRATNVKGDLPPESRKLWRYDPASGRYQVVDGSAAAYTPRLERPAKPFTLAYIDPWAANAFSIPVRENMKKYAQQLGLKLIYCDTAFKPEKAVECSELLAKQRPAFTIAGNWQSGASAAMIKVWDKVKVPTASFDVWQPNSVFFGADNYRSGVIGGKAAGDYAKRTWDCKDVWVFLGENKEEGEAADQRVAGFADGVQQVCGKLPSDQVQRQRMAAGTGDQALTATTDWLTAHPQAKHVLGTSLDDERASGIAKAFKASGRDAMAVGMTCDTVGIKLAQEAAPAENHSLGCVAFFPEQYAKYFTSIALDVVAGKPVPEEVHLEHKLLTHDTIGEYYK